MPNFVVGIDDIGTMHSQCSGWSIVVLGENVLKSFNGKASEILAESKLVSFHGKEFKRKKHASYTAFLSLIKETLEVGEGYACCTLLGADWRNEYNTFCSKVIGNSFAKARITSTAIVEGSKQVAAPLFTFQRISHTKNIGGSATVFIDRDSVLDNLQNADLFVEGHQISNKLPIIASLRAYGGAQFPEAPTIEQESIFITPDESSFIVQAADMIGNFSTAFAYQHLGKKSKTNDLKCKLFKDVFGDLFEMDTFPQEISLEHDELTLGEGAGSFTFCIG